MSDFTEFAREMLARFHIPAKCSSCGNTNLDELALTGRGKLICRQDIPEIREACAKQPGWRVVDAYGRVVSTGPGITFQFDSDMMS